MRVPSLRATLAVVAILFPSAAGALAACGSGSSGGGEPDASGTETSAPEAGDSSVQHDTSVAESGGDGPTDGGGGGDTGEVDTGMLGYADGGGFSGDCGVGLVGEPTDLRCTGLYSDWDAKTVAADMQEYDPGLHLWSDGADKTRWIYLPPGQKIDTTDMDEWTFPVDTKIFKEFRLTLADAAAETRIETRMLWKQSTTTWYRTTYIWTADGVTDAVEATDGELDAGGTGYEIPNQDQCNQCHNGRMDGVLGFEAVALSTSGASGLDMAALKTQDLLTAPPSAAITIPGNAKESAALAYLHMNCGTSCHNSGFGQAFPTGFFMRLDVAKLASVQATDTYTTGWNVPTQNFTIPDASASFRLHACSTASSCVYYRASVRDGLDGTPVNTQMPPIDTHKVDVPDLAVIAAWINEACDGGHD